MKVAAAQWPIEAVGSMTAWRAKLAAWLTRAADEGAHVAIVPEYAAMELTSLFAPTLDLQAQLAALQAIAQDYHAAYAELAQATQLTVVAGSFPEAVAEVYRNRARVYVPGSATPAIVEKLQMTRFERETWGVAGGAGQLVIATPHGRLGVAICYDSEFPLIVRRLVEAGAEVICVPSCTDSLAGYYRVRVACQARALENQCYVVQAPTVGSAPWSQAVDENIGAAAIYAPPDRGLPPTGVVAEGALNQPAWVHATLDLALIRACRVDGQVLGQRDWASPAHLAGGVAAWPEVV